MDARPGRVRRFAVAMASLDCGRHPDRGGGGLWGGCPGLSRTTPVRTEGRPPAGPDPVRTGGTGPSRRPARTTDLSPLSRRNREGAGRRATGRTGRMIHPGSSRRHPRHARALTRGGQRRLGRGLQHPPCRKGREAARGDPESLRPPPTASPH